MTRYRTKPCEIEAVRWNGNNLNEIISFVGKENLIIQTNLKIKTLEGDMTASIGDYIIKGLHGEFYPCKPDVFEKKYEQIKE